MALEPSHAAALNDLAYALAVHHPEAIKEALSFAQRAYALATDNAAIADTFAWILHLSGDNTEARRISPLGAWSSESRRNSASCGDYRCRCRRAYDASAPQLARTLELDAGLDATQEVQRLRATLASAEKK